MFSKSGAGLDILNVAYVLHRQGKFPKNRMYCYLNFMVCLDELIMSGQLVSCFALFCSKENIHVHSK